MHQYLKSIGLGLVKGKKAQKEVIRDTRDSFTQYDLVSQGEEDFCEYRKEYAPGIGISLYGTLEKDEIFSPDYYCPYLIGTGVTSYADIFVEQRIDKDSYVGICEEPKVGINLIFTLQNIMEYKKEVQRKGASIRYKSVTLSGLGNEGTILLPIKKNEEQQKKQQEDVHNRMMLMSAAKNGDPQAMESLTLEDIDTYSKVSRRLASEDVFSIVESYLMPYGVECDCYSVLGEILELYEVENELTTESLYIMKLEVNGLQFDVCVPAAGLTGEQKEGRRFKGVVWMQGRINF